MRCTYGVVGLKTELSDVHGRLVSYACTRDTSEYRSNYL